MATQRNDVPVKAQEKGQRFARHWTRHDVTADDDHINVSAANVCERRLERWEVGVNVTQGSDSHVDASSLFETSYHAVACVRSLAES